MNELKIPIKGWAALPVALALMGFLVYRMLTIQSTLASEASEELRFWLRAQYAREALGEIDVEKLDKRQVDPKVQRILDARKVEVISIRARGTDPIYVKIRIQVDGREPPDGRSTRYYIMEHSSVSGWRVRREISALAYYLHIF